jgi:hypothetical protein
MAKCGMAIQDMELVGTKVVFGPRQPIARVQVIIRTQPKIGW